MPESKKPRKKHHKDIQSDFINLTSHQLRTPLSGSKWLLELLQKPGTGSLNKKQRDFLEKINIENERMIALVNDLLEVTRIEAGQTKLYLQPTDLTTVIRGLIKEKGKEVKKKRLQIVFTMQQKPFPLVRTEMNKIRHAMSNLLSNAIAYTHEGGKITIDLQVQDGMLLGTISDTGVGIPKDMQDEIFTKFFRGANVTSLETTGTGLGLYISRAFIEASGGKLWFKSNEGQGTTFYFTLPIVR
ncbi:MAG: HAMP domain-containing sensor histidine kinase [Candidatus Doudnabacteria bacterium]